MAIGSLIGKAINGLDSSAAKSIGSSLRGSGNVKVLSRPSSRLPTRGAMGVYNGLGTDTAKGLRDSSRTMGNIKDITWASSRIPTRGPMGFFDGLNTSAGKGLNSGGGGSGNVRVKSWAKSKGMSAPGKLSMPQPGGHAYQGARSAVNASAHAWGNSGISAGSIALGAGGAAFAGAMVGGAYNDGGLGGGVAGAVAGVGIGAALAFGGPAAIGGALNHAARNPNVGKHISQYSSHITDVGRAVNSSGARATLFASGGLLGGAMFGGNRNSRRGFNKNRGSHIGR